MPTSDTTPYYIYTTYNPDNTANTDTDDNDKAFKAYVRIRSILASSPRTLQALSFELRRDSPLLAWLAAPSSVLSASLAEIQRESLV